jgi:hypothetical protein
VKKGPPATVAAVPVRAGAVLPCLCWADDGKSFFCVEDGVLRRLALNGFAELKRLAPEGKATWLAPSAQGLVLTVASIGEAQVLDPETLSVKKRIALPGAAPLKVLAGPRSSLAVALSASQVHLLDLEAGKVLRGFPARVSLAALAPDGGSLFTLGARGELCRYRVARTGLALVAATASMGSNPKSIQVSPDGRYVCLPCAGGNTGAGSYGTFVYDVNDLRAPAFTVPQGAYPHVMGFDPTAGLVYAHDFDTQLEVFDLRGRKLQEHVLSERSDEPRQFLAHPGGRRLLVLTGKKLVDVKLPPDGGP